MNTLVAQYTPLHLQQLGDLSNVTQSGFCIFAFPEDRTDLTPEPPETAYTGLSLSGQSVPGFITFGDLSPYGISGGKAIYLYVGVGANALIGVYIEGMAPEPIVQWQYQAMGILHPGTPDYFPISSTNSTWSYTQASVTPNPLSAMTRDSFGRSQIAGPLNQNDVVNKKYVDDYITNRAPFPPSVGGVKYVSVTSNAAWQQLVINTVNQVNSIPQRKGDGNIEVGITPSSLVDAASKAYVDGRTTAAIPTTATSAGVKGQIAVDYNWLYVCVATNTWQRIGLNTW